MPKRQIPGADEGGVFHVTSRVVDRRMIFEEEEKRRFLWLAKAYGAFGGLELVTWCVMGNHFHLLVRVPPGSGRRSMALTEEQVLARMARIYSKSEMEDFRCVLGACGRAEGRKALLDVHRRRMGRLSVMMQGVKQRFSRWYNLTTNRTGTLWEERYHCVVIQERLPDGHETGLGRLAEVVAAYIDLNPLRAGLVEVADAYEWSGHGAACRGDWVAAAGQRLLHGVNKRGIRWCTRLAREMHESLLAAEWEGVCARTGRRGGAAAVRQGVFSGAHVLGSAAYVRKLRGHTPGGKPRVGRKLEGLACDMEGWSPRAYGARHDSGGGGCVLKNPGKGAG